MGDCVRKRILKMEYSDTVDRISDLPDHIIHYILSFLDMQIVVRTSCLSTRWRDLWRFTPYLNFHVTHSGEDEEVFSQENKLKRKRFLKFVDQVLNCRDDDTDMQKFSISSELVFNGDHLHTWLVRALRRKVKELSLLLYHLQPFTIPSSIFTSSEITVLELSNYILDEEDEEIEPQNIFVELPDTFCSAARIKSLKLEYIKLPYGNSDGELVLKCPVLENLIMINCADNHLEVLTIACPLLKILEFTQVDYYDEDSCKINISSPNITFFSCYFMGYPHISVVNLPSLVRAKIFLSGGDEMETDSYDELVIGVLRGIYNVIDLNIASITLMEMSVCPKILEMLPNLLQNLRDVTVEDDDGENGMASISAMTNVLKILPFIRSFVWDRTMSPKGDDRGQELGVHAIFSSLKKVEIRNPHGVDDELKFVGFLLERAVFLDEMIITITDADRLVSHEFIQKLLALPRYSTAAHLQYRLRCGKRSVTLSSSIRQTASWMFLNLVCGEDLAMGSYRKPTSEGQSEDVDEATNETQNIIFPSTANQGKRSRQCFMQ